MQGPNKIFEETAINYLKDIKTLDFKSLSGKLGLRPHGNRHMIRFLNKDYIISDSGFYTVSNENAPYDVLIVLCRYLLLCPKEEPKGKELSSFRDLKDSGPLTVYFSHDVEMKIANHFAGKKDQLAKACKALGGFENGDFEGYDVGARFDVLPKIPVVLFFNDRDDEFDATAKLLFEKRAEAYLDAECLAILGNIFYRSLIT